MGTQGKTIRYQFIDINGAAYNIEAFDEPVLNDDEIKTDVKVIEKTFRDGAVFSGIIRVMSKDIEFEYNQINNNDASFRSAVNMMILWAKKAVKVRDILLNIETPILFSGIKINYDKGSFLRSAKIRMNFKRTLPYWEDINYTQYNISMPSGGTSGVIETVSITNNGYSEVQPIITLTAQELTTKFFFHIPSTNEGMYIKDLQFGMLGLTEYVINCNEGWVKLSGNRRNNMIQNDTGFFNFPVGTFDLDYQFNGDCDILIQFKERYYI